MRLMILWFFLILPLPILYSQETIAELFSKKMSPTPELIKEWRSKSKIDENYDFVKYIVRDDILFSKIDAISNRIFSKKSKRYGPKTNSTVEIIKVKEILYIMLYFNPFYRFERPRYPMPQPAGFVNYKGRIYELIFWNKDPGLFTPTKYKKRIIYKKDKNDLHIHFDSPEIYLQIKGNEVKEISRDTIIK